MNGVSKQITENNVDVEELERYEIEGSRNNERSDNAHEIHASD